jgi:uncharacterized membrane protein
MHSKLKPYNIYLLFLAVINITPVLAPVLYAAREASTVLGNIGKLIYLIYSFTCHQFAYRSIHLFDYQLAWCARDTGIWMGVLIGAVIARHHKYKGIPWFYVPALLLPMILDGGIQTIATILGIGSNFAGSTSSILYMSNNLTRFITGGLFGLGVSLWLSYWLIQGMQLQPGDKLEAATQQIKLWTKAAVKPVLTGLLALCLAYLGLIATWRITSTTNLPIDALDSAPKTPTNAIFERREHAPCQTGLEDLIAWDCWWN